MPPCVTVLAEDKSAQGDGLHALVSACIVDQIGGERWHLQTVELDWRFLGPNQSVLESCKKLGRLARDGRPVVALLDGDRIRQAVSLQHGASVDQVRQFIKGKSDDPSRLHVFFLESNAETIVKAVAACAPKDVREDSVRRALKKDRLHRDRILRRAASADRPVRDCVLKEVPSLQEAVTFLTNAVRKCRQARLMDQGGTPQAPR